MPTKKLIMLLLCLPLCVVGKNVDLKKEHHSYKVNLGVAVPFQMGIQGQYYFPQRHYYLKGGAGFAISAFMQLREKLLKQFHFASDHYEQTLIELMTHSVVFDARVGWAKYIDEGPYIELGWGLLLWGEELTMDAQRIKKVFDYSTKNPNSKTGGQNIFHVDMLNHGPTFYMGYAFSLMDQFFLNMEFGVYKPFFGLSDFSLRGSLNNNTTSERLYHIIRKDLWIFSLGLWLGFLF